MRHTEIHVENIITSRIRRRRENIDRIGIHRGPDGWACHSVSMVNGSPMPSDGETKVLLAEADRILAELLLDDRKLPRSPLDDIAKG